MGGGKGEEEGKGTHTFGGVVPPPPPPFFLSPPRPPPSSRVKITPPTRKNQNIIFD